MDKERLLKLADLLEADAANEKGIQFDLGDWGTSCTTDIEPNCGTSACAMGLAVASGAFKDDGLSNGSTHEFWILPKFGDDTGFAAAALLFGISHRESNFLFDQKYYPEDKRRFAEGELYVAQRIRDFVAGTVSPKQPFSPPLMCEV